MAKDSFEVQLLIDFSSFKAFDGIRRSRCPAKFDYDHCVKGALNQRLVCFRKSQIAPRIAVASPLITDFAEHVREWRFDLKDFTNGGKFG